MFLSRSAVFLDRDGTLIKSKNVNGKPVAVNKISEIELEPHVLKLCENLRTAGLLLILVTNQPDASLGPKIKSNVIEINDYLKKLLKLNAVYTCFHNKKFGCQCRKPGIGLIQRAVLDFGVDLKSSFLIGDRYSDIEAGRSSGCLVSILIERGYSELPTANPDYIVSSLSEAVSIVLHLKSAKGK